MEIWRLHTGCLSLICMKRRFSRLLTGYQDFMAIFFFSSFAHLAVPWLGIEHSLKEDLVRLMFGIKILVDVSLKLSQC